MTPPEVIEQRCKTILAEPVKRGLVAGLGLAYKLTDEIASEFPPELQSRAFGNHLWAQAQKELLEVAENFSEFVTAKFLTVESNGFPYLAWTCADELLLTVKRTNFEDQLVNDSYYRRVHAGAIQPRLLYGDWEEPGVREPETVSLYGVILHGLEPSITDRSKPSFITLAFPDSTFTRYVHTIDLLGALDPAGLVPTIETGLREEVSEWLARPKRKVE